MDCCGASSRKADEAQAPDQVDFVPPEDDKDQASSAKEAEIAAALKGVKNRFVNSKRFQDMCKNAFEQVDLDKSNSLDENEVYIAVLLLYLKIAGICKGAVPPTRDDIIDLMTQFESPKSPKQLDYKHFEQFCQYLCSQIAGRVATQMFMQMALAPLLGLVVCHFWEMLMLAYAKDLYEKCTSYVPTEVVVTLFVGIGVSMFVPPLMNFVDWLILNEAAAIKKKVKNKKR
jgi:hypothetical protein